MDYETCDLHVGLLPKLKSAQRIGLLLDCGIQKDLQLRHLQVANAAKATLGIDIHHIVFTQEPVDVTLSSSSISGSSWGGVGMSLNTSSFICIKVKLPS